jgi:Tol biopolymer transport system component
MNPDDPAGPTISVNNIWIINADGTELRPLTRSKAPAKHSSQPFWSPDGLSIVFSSFLNLATPLDPTSLRNAVSNVWTVQPDGMGLKHVTDLTKAANEAAFWAPDGSSILFDSEGILNPSQPDVIGLTGNLWKVDPDGTNRLPITQYHSPDIREFDPVHASPQIGGIF